jgi:hypothetical protein
LAEADSIVVARVSEESLVARYVSFESQPSIIRPIIPNNEARQAANKTFVVSGESLWVVSGDYETNPGDEVTNDNTSGKTFIYKYALGGDSSSPQQILESKQGYNSAVVCDTGTLCLDRGGNLEVYRTGEDNQMVEIMRVIGITQMVSIPDGAAYLQNGRIYALNTRSLSANLVYESTKFNVSTLSASNEQLVVSAFLNNSNDKSLHAFVISNNPASTPSFIDDKLPYYKNEYPGVSDMDYVDKTIVVSLLLDTAYLDENTNKIAYDQADYAAVTGEILAQLGRDGAGADYTVYFIPIY